MEERKGWRKDKRRERGVFEGKLLLQNGFGSSKGTWYGTKYSYYVDDAERKDSGIPLLAMKAEDGRHRLVEERD